MLLGIMAWMPLVPSTAWVTLKSTDPGSHHRAAQWPVGVGDHNFPDLELQH
jgi:hypothetical protein